MKLDAIILAGGKSERLQGIVPPYFKPFVVINGKSLLIHAVDEATAAGAQRIVVVATGENALPVWQLVQDRDNVRVLLSAGGPAAAVHAGLELCTEDRVLVLMSDNLHGPQDVAAVTAHDYAIGVRRLDCEEAQRFTRYMPSSSFGPGEWVEGRGDYDHDCLGKSCLLKVWCGPLVINRERGTKLLDNQWNIGPFVGVLGKSMAHVNVKTIDAGVPVVVTTLTRISGFEH